MGSITFVCEGRGLGGGTHSYARRVHAYVTGTKSLIKTAYDNHETVKAEVSKGRQAMIDKGKVFDSADVIALTFASSSAANATYPGKHVSNYTDAVPVYDISGQMQTISRSTQPRANNITRSRPRPTAYVIPKSIDRTATANVATVTAANGYAINYNFLLDLMSSQDIYYYEVPAGTKATLKKYFRDNTSNSLTSNVNAGLRAEAEVTFPNGAYVVPMDQVTGAVIAMLFEPDVAGSGGYNGTVNQALTGEAMPLILHDFTTRDLPYYRLEQDNPRQVLQDPSLVVSVDINSTDITLQVGETAALIATAQPNTAINKDLIWSSSNMNLVSVDQTGGILARTPGTATIIASSDENPSIAAKCIVTVSVPVITITTHPTPTTALTVGNISGSLSVAVSVTGAGVTLSYQWYSNTANNNTGGSAISGATNTSFAIPTNLALGTYYYYCVVSGTHSAVSKPSNVATVTVTAPVISITSQPQSANFVAGSITGSLSVQASATPSGTQLNYQWYSNTTNSSSGGSAVSGATNASFTIPTGLAAGTHYYYCVVGAANAASVTSGVATVRVTAADIRVTGVSVMPKSATVETGNTTNLSVTITPTNATNQAVEWDSNDPAVATVNANGVVRAIGGGTAIITVTTVDGGHTDTCAITVPAPESVDPKFPSDIDDAAKKTGISPNDLEAKDGKVSLKKSTAEKAARELLGVGIVDTTISPIFSGTVAQTGSVAEITYKMTGKELLALLPEDINVIGKAGDAWKLFEYIKDTADYADGKFALLLGGVPYTGEIDPDEVYDLVLYIEDGGVFDCDGLVNGEVTATIFFAAEKAKKSGGGCNAYGYLALALLAIPFVLKRNRF
jgi:Synergist-CTERM protein sorting domain-containing protein